MFWLFKKLITLGIFVGLILVILQLDYQGKPVREHLRVVWESPLVQEVSRQVRKLASQWGSKTNSGPPMEELKEKERRELEKLLEQESKE